jgi:hypothetical protein
VSYFVTGAFFPDRAGAASAPLYFWLLPLSPPLSPHPPLTHTTTTTTPTKNNPNNPQNKKNSAGIANWIKKKTGPPAATIADADALKALEKDNAVLVVGYFKAFKGSEHEAFTKFAQKTEDAAFAQTDNADVAKAAGISSAPGFAVVANHPDEERATAAGKKVNADQLEALLKENKLPVVVPFNDKNSPKIFGSGIEKQVLLVAKAADLDLKAGAKAIKAFRSVATGLRGKLTFVTVDLDSKGSAPVTGFFGVKEEVREEGDFFSFFPCAPPSAEQRARTKTTDARSPPKKTPNPPQKTPKTTQNRTPPSSSASRCRPTRSTR